MPRRANRSQEGQKFGEVIRRMRKEVGFSQEALAEKADLAADYVGFIERGDNVPTLTVILKIARAFKVTPSELLRDIR